MLKLGMPPQIQAASKTLEIQSAIDYQILRGAKAEGNAVDIYGFTSPYIKPSSSKKDKFDQDDISSSKSLDSANSKKIKIVQEEQLLGECHIGFEKLLQSLFQFQARKNLSLINNSNLESSVQKVPQLDDNEIEDQE